MRIATWNVNSLKARQDKVEQWLARATPDVLLIQETKLTDADSPAMPFAMAGYDLLHHGEGRWNGVGIGQLRLLDEEDVRLGPGEPLLDLLLAGLERVDVPRRDPHWLVAPTAAGRAAGRDRTRRCRRSP